MINSVKSMLVAIGEASLWARQGLRRTLKRKVIKFFHLKHGKNKRLLHGKNKRLIKSKRNTNRNKLMNCWMENIRQLF
jgi:hypothetical protein